MSRITDALDAGGQIPVWRNLVQAHECEGSKFHSPTPLIVAPFCPDGVLRDAYARDEPSLWLCSTCRDNLSVYLTILKAYNGVPPKAVRRDFGNAIRALGDRAWADHLKWSADSPV